MKLVRNMMVAGMLVVLISLGAHAADKAATEEKPALQDVSLLTIEATVESIDRQTREVTLKNNKGETETFTLDPQAGELDQIDPGDQVTIEYLEAITIQVFEPGKAKPGVVDEAFVAESKPGEKPAGLAVGQTTVVVTIESIDLEKELVTLKDNKGELKTVKPRHPENLKKVKVGDKVKITYTEAVGFSVIEKPTANH